MYCQVEHEELPPNSERNKHSRCHDHAGTFLEVARLCMALQDSKLFLLDVAQRMQFCYDEQLCSSYALISSFQMQGEVPYALSRILSNAHQQDLFVKLGLIAASATSLLIYCKQYS